MEFSGTEPSTAVAEFWATIRQPGHESIAEAARQTILRACPSVNTFSFELVEEDLAIGAAPRESPVASVETGTPRPVIEAWNQERLVHLVVFDSGVICGAAVGNDVPVAARDFKACALPSSGDEGVKCGYGGHVGPRVKRLSPSSGSYFIAIPVPSGTGKVKLVFSRPILEEKDFFYLPRSSSDFSKLFSYQMEPRVWKILFELFPGPSILDPAGDIKLELPPISTSSEAVSTPLAHRPANPSSALATKEVSDSPISSPGGGLGGFQGVQDAIAAGQMPSDEGGWNFDDDDDSQPTQQKFDWDSPMRLRHDSSDIYSRTSSTSCQEPPQSDNGIFQLVLELKSRLEELEIREKKFLGMERARERSLAEKFHSIELENSKLKKRLRETQDAMQRGHPIGTQPSLPLNKRDLERVAREVYRGLDLSHYVKGVDITNVAVNATASHMQEILKRMEAVEHEMFNNAGIAPLLLSRVQALEASKAINSIEMGGHVFVDEAATEAWGRAHADPNLHRFCPDFVSLFLLAEPKYETVQEGLGQMAAVVKANFQSIDEATIGLSYSIIYPPRIIKASDKQEAQQTDGFTWAPPFVSFEVFEGDYHNGTRMRLKKSLDSVAKAIESGIDFHFPISTRPKSNAVFKAQTQLAHRQACEFLEALAPLYKQISGGGMSNKEAWSRVMVFARQIFTDIATVRALNSEGSLGSMIWASFRTSELLKEYQRHNWVEHPKTSSILALTSMRKEGKAIEEVNSKLIAHNTVLNRHTGDIKKLQDDIKELKKKNPSLV